MVARGARLILPWVALIALLAGVRLALLAAMPLTDPTEGRYAAMAHDMVRTGSWGTPQVWVDGERIPYVGKPPLPIWLMAASIHLFGASAFAVRLPSFLAAVGLLGLMATVLKRARSHRVARRALWITAASTFFYALSGAAAYDMPLTLATTGALLCYARFVEQQDRRRRREWSLGVFFFLGLGLMTKGLVALVLFGLPTLIWTWRYRAWETLRNHAWVRGSALFILIVVPWFAYQEAMSPGFLRYFLVNEHLLRYTVENYGDRYGYGHVFPYGSSIGLMAVGFLPWTVAVPLLLRRQGREAGGDPIETDALFLFAWISHVLFFALSRQMLWAYLLPAVVLCSIWAALRLDRIPALGRKVRGTALAWIALVSILFTVGTLVPRHLRSTGPLIEKLTAAYDRGPRPLLLFYGSPAYSAQFYWPDQIIQLPRILDEEAWSSAISAHPDALIVLRDKHVERMPGRVIADDYVEIERAGRWRAFARRSGPPSRAGARGRSRGRGGGGEEPPHLARARSLRSAGRSARPGRASSPFP